MSSTLEALQAERDLLDLLARFDDGAIRTDIAEFRKLWTEDAVWEIGEPVPMRAIGIDAVVGALVELQKQNLFFFRITARPVFQINGDHASLRSTTVELAGRSGGKAYANVALYEDEAVRGSDGAWRFSKRSYVYLWVDTNAELGGQTVPLSAAQ